MRRILIYNFVLFFIVLSLTNCKIGEDTETNNPFPLLTKISPSSKVTNMPSFILTAEGSGFVSTSKIVFNGGSLETNYINSTQINAVIDSSLIKNSNQRTANLQTENVSVSVNNPSPGGGNSNTLDLNILDNHLFIDPIEIAKNGYSYSKPVITVGELGEIYIVFESYNYNTELYFISFVKSDDYGNSWSEPENLVEFNEKCYNPAIAVGPAGDIYVTFYVEKLYFVSLMIGNSQWSTPVELTGDTNYPLKSAIYVDKDNFVSIIWPQTENNYNYKVYYTKSSGDNISFSTPQNIFANWENYSTTYAPAITADGDGNVYATWTSWPAGGDRYSYTQFNYSNDGGLNWAPSETVFNVCSSSDLDVDSSGNLCLIVSNSYLPFQNQIIFYNSVDNGLSFNTGIRTTANSSDYEPKISIDMVSNYNIIFERSNQVHYCRSIDKGLTWSTPFSIGSSYNSWETSDMDLDNEGNIYITYMYGADKLHFIRNDND